MNAVIGIGKYLLALAMAAFGVNHLRYADAMSAMAPFGGSIIIYITGACLILFAISVFIGKFDKLAALLLAVFLLLCVLFLHIKGLSDPNMAQMSMVNLLKDLALIGASLMYAGAYAKDNSVVG